MSKKSHTTSIASHVAMSALAAASAFGCTGQLPGSLLLTQQEETFSTQKEINTKIDLLWVVDNSASMDVSQKKLRDGFTTFASKYMQPTWDIRVAVITTDTYMANPAFSGYLSRNIASTTGWTSPLIAARLSSWTNPSTNPTQVNTSTGVFTNGVTYGDLVPLWGPSYSRLLEGFHDGPITAMCFELLPYFTRGVSHCQTRDLHTYTGADECLNPTGSNTSLTQCVNTTQNDTVRSGKAIISTMPPTGTLADAEWKANLIKNFMINVSTGSAGQGSERGLSSVLQLIADNETSSTAFFRANSLRGIIFVSDEDDQSLETPTTPDSTFKPQSYYKCDQSTLLSLNAANLVTGNNGLCCTDGAKNCSYGSLGTSCSPKIIDGQSHTITICPDETKLIAVSSVKDQIDTFFHTLDQTDAAASTNYFVTSIVPMSYASIQALQADRASEDANVGAVKTVAVDRGDRYLTLGELVGNGSLSMDIGESDYTQVLESIGRAIIEKKSKFTLDRAPTGEEDMLVTLSHGDGTVELIAPDQYIISGKDLILTGESFVLGLKADDKISINYQPKSLF